MSLFIIIVYVLQATIRDLFTVNVESDLQEIVEETQTEADKVVEEPPKKPAKSQNAFEQVSLHMIPSL